MTSAELAEWIAAASDPALTAFLLDRASIASAWASEQRAAGLCNDKPGGYGPREN